MSPFATLALAGALLSPHSGQQPAQPPSPSCPVQILSATYAQTGNPQRMLDPKTMKSTSVFGTLHLRYRNNSGKAIRSVDVTAHFAPKSGVAPPLYTQPDPNAQQFSLEGASTGAERNASLRVSVDGTTLQLIEVTAVHFADGTDQAAASGADALSPCAYTPPAMVKPAKK